MLQDHVKVGIWIKATATNDFNALLLTLPYKWGTVVLTAVAVLVTYASAQYWSIFRFAIYWYVESRRHPKDEYLRQLEVALRNSQTALSTIFDCISIARRRRRHHPTQPLHLAHILTVLLLASAHILAFTALGALTPLVLIETTAKIRPRNCGYWPINVDGLFALADQQSVLAGLAQLAQFVSNGTSATTAYVRSCYGAEPEDAGCSAMLNRRIPWTGTHGTPCPFRSGQCVGGDNGAFTMDTGNLPVTYYGIDVKSRLTVRRQSTCAPIAMQPYLVSTAAGSGYSHVRYLGQNITVQNRDDAADPYVVKAFYPLPGVEVHPNLQPAIGNVSVIYLSRNNLTHIYPSDDPIFAATVQVPLPYISTGYVPSWQDRLGALACVDKVQICRDLGRGECSPWTGAVRGYGGEMGIADFYDRSSAQDKGLMSLLWPKTSVLQTIGDAARGTESTLMASRSLLSISLLQTSAQTAHGSEQWKAEVSQWFDIILAVSQLAVVHFPNGPPFLDTSQLVNEMAPESRFICTSILINSSAHITIRLAGVIVVAVGALLATLLNPETAVFPCGRVFRRWPRSARGWRRDSALHLLEGGRANAYPMECGAEGLVPRGAEAAAYSALRASEDPPERPSRELRTSGATEQQQSLVGGHGSSESGAGYGKSGSVMSGMGGV